MLAIKLSNGCSESVEIHRTQVCIDKQHIYSKIHLSSAKILFKKGDDSKNRFLSFLQESDSLFFFSYFLSPVSFFELINLKMLILNLKISKIKI